MLILVSKWFRKRRRRRAPTKHATDNWSSWTRIGGYDYTTADMKQVPGWVRNGMKELELVGAAHEGRYFELRGKHYRYRIVPRGNGAPIVYILRRRR